MAKLKPAIFNNSVFNEIFAVNFNNIELNIQVYTSYMYVL